MIKVEPDTQVEVGKFYLVKCAKMINNYGKVVDYIPVIGEEHKDPQFGVKFSHYHVDGRFKNNYTDRDGRTNSVFSKESIGYDKCIAEIVWKKRKCIRTTTGIKPPRHKDEIYYPWYKSYIGKSCKGRKCPHLGTAMNLVDGKLVCPLHNLTGCAEKEVIIPLEIHK